MNQPTSLAYLFYAVACALATIGCRTEPAQQVTVVACAKDGTCPAGRCCAAGLCQSCSDASSGASSDAASSTEAGANRGQGSDGAATSADASAETAAVCEADPSGGPSPRGDVAAGYVGGKLVVLYGDEGAPIQCQANPKYTSDAHLFDPCKGWEAPKSATMPPPRARAAQAYDRDHDALWLFGGRYRKTNSGPYTNYNDLWRYGGSDGQMLLVDEGKAGPSARSNSCMGYQRQTQKLWVFGGNSSTSGLQFTPLADLWSYDTSSAQWAKPTTTGKAPSARLFHSCAVSDDGKVLVVYGGGGVNAFQGPFFGDTFVLDLTTLAWSAIEGQAPMARIKAGMAPAPDSPAIWLFGGHDDGAVGNRNDLWTFDTAKLAWNQLRKGDLGANANPDVVHKPAHAFCDFPPDFMLVDKDSPERREAMGLTADAQGNLWMFGGKSDCGVLRDVWRYQPKADQWINLDDTTIGWSCDRYKKPCNTLCN
ncbi:MAG: hypothetical protein FJ100_04230 [Deltaproteobacteria bacterium]|nr:hypothetical protein [Deltaproteobacteria bacterium]